MICWNFIIMITIIQRICLIPRKVLGTLNYPWINSDLKENKQSPVSWQISKPELKILIRTTIPGNIDGQLQTLQVLTNAPQLRFVGWLSILSYVQNLCLPMYNLVIREIVLCLPAVKHRRFISTWKSEQMFQNVFQRFFYSDGVNIQIHFCTYLIIVA